MGLGALRRGLLAGQGPSGADRGACRGVASRSDAHQQGQEQLAAPQPELAAGEDGLTISPEIWHSLNGRITQLEDKVKILTEEDLKSRERVSFLENLLRCAMRVIRGQSRTLRRHGLAEEPLPAVLVPFSID